MVTFFHSTLLTTSRCSARRPRGKPSEQELLEERGMLVFLQLSATSSTTVIITFEEESENIFEVLSALIIK
jgi:hypothetical protein